MLQDKVVWTWGGDFQKSSQHPSIKQLNSRERCVSGIAEIARDRRHRRHRGKGQNLTTDERGLTRIGRGVQEARRQDDELFIGPEACSGADPSGPVRPLMTARPH